jgi:fumarylacetoacetate (FAA) hydrolase
LVAPNRQIPMPVATDELSYEPQLGVIVSNAGANLTVEEADGYILGLTIVLTLVARDIERTERAEAWGPGRSRDFGTVVGPFITTPEELDDIVVDESRGRRYKFNAVVRINGEEAGRQDLTELPYTAAELVSFASETCVLAPGDLVTLGPLAMKENTKLMLGPGDEVHVTVERLGTLVTKIT